MKSYALIQAGKLHEIIDIEDGTPSIHERYHRSFIDCMCDITSLIPPPQVGWLFSWETGQFAEAIGYAQTPEIDSMLTDNTDQPVLPEDTPKEIAQDGVVVNELLNTAYDEAQQ